jgi:hypothetical protein
METDGSENLMISSYRGVKDPEGQWRFILLAVEGKAKTVLGLEECCGRSGMLEQTFRALLKTDFQLSPNVVDQMVQLAKEKKSRVNIRSLTRPLRG